ncbi:MAG: hypothetical protein IJS52_02770 [Bacilli bacterium]|nr:hypothetical protein [Bacilli bacterium]
MDEVRRDQDGTIRATEYRFSAYGMSGMAGYIEFIFEKEQGETLLNHLSTQDPDEDPLKLLKKLKEPELIALCERLGVAYNRNEGAE